MSDPIVLNDASPEQQVQAAADNHRELFCLSALASGGEVMTADGVTWTYGGPKTASMIAFPTLPPDRAGMQLDEIVDYYLHHYTPKLVGCWSLDSPESRDLAALLLARGFQPGWRPCWMALNLDQVLTDHPRPPDLTVEADSESDLRVFKHLPYTQPDEGGTPLELVQQYRDRVRRFIAKLGGNVVGQSVVFMTRGPYGAAGIYDVGVAPEARNQGIGKAVVLAACLYARERGYHYAVLNATGRRMYQQLGFQWLGDGWTWWLNIPRLAAYEAQGHSPGKIAFAEAVGRGDVAALNTVGTHIGSDELNVPLANEMTLLQLAVHLRQSASAEWLVAHGETLDVLSAWDLGWQERGALLLANDPHLANQRYGMQKLTLLHEAASRGDVALARLALSAHPDLTLKDQTYQSTPLGWAKHLNRTEIIRLIEEHMGG